jgi:hypothetical protein
LRSLHIEYSGEQHGVVAQGDDALAPLSALQRPTQLHLPEVRSAQLAVLQLPRLQQLQLKRCEFGQGQQLQLDHLTALQQLQLNDCGIRSTQRSRGQAHSGGLEKNVSWSSAGRLPPKLRELQWWRRCDGIGCSVQQLLPLRQLQKLLLFGEMSEPEEQQLPQLTSLVTITELGLCCSAATAAACCALPIKALEVTSDDATPAALQQLCALSSLTHLNICGSHLPATPAQLSAALTQLTALHHVSIGGFRTTAADRPARATRSSRSAAAQTSSGTGGRGDAASSARVEHDVEGIALLLRAVARLPELGSVWVGLPVVLMSSGVRQLKDAVQEQLPAWLQAGFSSSGRTCTLRVGYGTWIQHM